MAISADSSLRAACDRRGLGRLAVHEPQAGVVARPADAVAGAEPPSLRPRLRQVVPGTGRGDFGHLTHGVEDQSASGPVAGPTQSGRIGSESALPAGRPTHRTPGRPQTPLPVSGPLGASDPPSPAAGRARAAGPTSMPKGTTHERRHLAPRPRIRLCAGSLSSREADRRRGPFPTACASSSCRRSSWFLSQDRDGSKSPKSNPEP